MTPWYVPRVALARDTVTRSEGFGPLPSVTVNVPGDAIGPKSAMPVAGLNALTMTSFVIDPLACRR